MSNDNIVERIHLKILILPTNTVASEITIKPSLCYIRTILYLMLFARINGKLPSLYWTGILMERVVYHSG